MLRTRAQSGINSGSKRINGRLGVLLAGVLQAVPTPLACRRQAFPFQNIPLFRQVCAVPFAAVRCAGLPLGAHHHIGASTKNTFSFAAAVFPAEALALRVGGAARHRAWLVSATVFAAMRRSRVCVGAASCKLAVSMRSMFAADTTCLRKSGAPFLFANFLLAATAVLPAPASGFDGTGALVERAGPKCAMFIAKPACLGNITAAFCRARHCPAVVLLALPSNRDGVGDARVQGAVSIGAVLDADKLAEDLRGLAVWIGAGQLHRVLEAQAAFLHRGGGATFSKTLAFCAVFAAQPPCVRLGGAAVDRARLPAVMCTEPSIFHFVGATTNRTHFSLPPPSPLLFLIPQQL